MNYLVVDLYQQQCIQKIRLLGSPESYVKKRVRLFIYTSKMLKGRKQLKLYPAIPSGNPLYRDSSNGLSFQFAPIIG
jgi:hypothetical protein